MRSHSGDTYAIMHEAASCRRRCRQQQTELTENKQDADALEVGCGGTHVSLSIPLDGRVAPVPLPTGRAETKTFTLSSINYVLKTLPEFAGRLIQVVCCILKLYESFVV